MTRSSSVRHGTTTLFAALEVATGRVEQLCLPQHRHQEFLRFLKQVAKAYLSRPVRNRPRSLRRRDRKLRREGPTECATV